MNGDDQQVPSPFQSLMAPQQQPQQQGGSTLRTLLMTALPALSAMLTSNRWEGRGAATGRGIAAGLAGYAAAQPRQKTGEERYWDAKAQELERTQNQIAQLMRDPELQKDLTAEERLMMATDPKDFFKTQVLRKEMASNKKTLSEYFKIPAEAIPDDPKTVSAWVQSEVKAKTQGKKLTYKEMAGGIYGLDTRGNDPPVYVGSAKSPELQFKDVVNPETGKTEVVGLDPRTGKPRTVVGEAPAKATAGLKQLTPNEAANIVQKGAAAYQREFAFAPAGQLKPDFDEWWKNSPYGQLSLDSLKAVIQGKPQATAKLRAEPTPGAATHRYNPATGEIEAITP